METKTPNKPIIVFTNFWDAYYLLNKGYFLIQSKNKNKALKINLVSETTNGGYDFDDNYKIYSIALSKPKDPKLKNLEFIKTLHFLCPTYSILNTYKKNMNEESWEIYRQSYKELLKERKEEVKDWINSLIPGTISILCCWENTSKGAHCHRRILFDEFNKSKSINSKVISLYRN